MREIKYRAWDKLNRRFINISSIALSHDGSVVGIWELKIEGSELYGLHQVELMQSTGLKDRNGKEIYRGDIVIFKDRKYVVTYLDRVAGFRLHWTVFHTMKAGVSLGTCKRFRDNNVSQDMYEVIGNVYENPELI